MTMHTNPQTPPHLDPPSGDAGDTSSAGRLAKPLQTVWADKRLAWTVALLAAAGYGLLAGWWMPRGPLSTFEALAAMGLGLLVGLIAGLLLRTRWAMLAAPLAFAVVFEPVRLGVSGPTVDGIHLGSTYGVMAFAVGRSFGEE